MSGTNKKKKTEEFFFISFFFGERCFRLHTQFTNKLLGANPGPNSEKNKNTNGTTSLSVKKKWRSSQAQVKPREPVCFFIFSPSFLSPFLKKHTEKKKQEGKSATTAWASKDLRKRTNKLAPRGKPSFSFCHLFFLFLFRWRSYHNYVNALQGV